MKTGLTKNLSVFHECSERSRCACTYDSRLHMEWNVARSMRLEKYNRHRRAVHSQSNPLRVKPKRSVVVGEVGGGGLCIGGPCATDDAQRQRLGGSGLWQVGTRCREHAQSWGGPR